MFTFLTIITSDREHGSILLINVAMETEREGEREGGRKKGEFKAQHGDTILVFLVMSYVEFFLSDVLLV